ncbi:alpha/beta fold hydrolase [Photorhabdus laumondii subsp. laumondii]|uniref:Photorhabdus luminescens subsp. laumondii TTO1 complete genome segment 6/17 n=2 Tax=Photorhabdus laumondii subsp. laumondii TaxID=141679 RepID=Q7N6L8_PHOLL|nr:MULTISPECIES: alpha/beta hydrolase [Photorhabdus]AWK41389.1 MhpC protein [Photorhabdus laumondii subsp. laumondii]AXG42119.1 alpha/beta hydrolase [Photorhabdus laumondii subsp. laumondii]AXG46711.1 alpha/beta hydrolase [Photorhabdus laumondii subsp. laumondii]KTL61134.1 MhpC protein [Photorhabdus laumondii subsp. laumondii]MCC8385580.1 alpha/beta hydrolase [Photorhabdus laumondii]
MLTYNKALEFFGRDFKFPHTIKELPEKLSDLKDLEIGFFKTSDEVSLSFWKAGKGETLIFIPGWSSHGAEYINIIYLLSKKYEVYVLDQRNHGLSQKVNYGNRISRFSADLHEFIVAVNIKKAYFCGWSMGCSVLWSYIDLFGLEVIKKIALIDEPPSIYCHADWSEEERIKAGAFTNSPEALIDVYSGKIPGNKMFFNSDILKYYTTEGAPAFFNSQTFANEFVPQSIDDLKSVLFEHILNDWRDVISHKITVPTLIFSGENSDWIESQQWISSTVPKGEIIIYGREEHGDHFLALKDPLRFSKDLSAFFY